MGISGWRYPAWRSVFYPEGLPQARELAFASRSVRTIEINGFFSSLQRPSSYRAWLYRAAQDARAESATDQGPPARPTWDRWRLGPRRSA